MCMERIEAFLNSENNKYDAYLVLSEVNRFYFMGYESTAGYLLLSKFGCYFLTDPRYSEEAEASVKGVTVVSVEGGKTFAEATKEVITRLGITELGYEDKTVLYSEYRMLEGLDVPLKPASDLINAQRMIKTEEEIGFIARACKIGDTALKELMRRIKPGITERELAVELEYLMNVNGGEGASFATISAFGTNTSRPHAHPSDKKLVKGDVVTLDFGCKYRGYCSDMTRTFAVGSISKEMKNIYNIVLEAQKYAMSAIKPGMTGREADSFAREYIISRGYDIPHSVGHGAGVEIHEEPYVSMRSETILQKNMVISCEPGIYVAGLGGVRIEDLTVIREDGLQALTLSPKELIIL